ncbi:CMGC MAPK family protein [Cyclospora cayetanensis]|uniref:CMGC MAPK family protein n=1 Tax=Cyclospora cayetanensis TaxID=88456 RepID=A0A1D3CX28_9EIME|nr:CMGC MAPK family protein [Cyclospora cayetanensis]
MQQPQRCAQPPAPQHAQRHQNHDPQRKAQHAVKPTTRMPHPLTDWQLPERYELHHLIGTGSYGHVCEVYDNQEQRIVAIKKIHRVFEDLIDCKRILREIAILNRLNHNHIVKILDILVPTDLEKFDEMYVVLEIADSDFKKLFRAPVYLTELHIKTLLYNLLVGVKRLESWALWLRAAYLSSLMALLCPQKPANCLVNQDCSVKVCDFGLARTMDFPEGHSSHNPITQQDDDIVNVPHTKNLKRQLTGHVVTRWYRAPELILLAENYTEAIDVWSIGCIFSELLSMIEENVESHCDRGPLFPGSSCFPLSPDQKNGDDSKLQTRGNKDQLNVIFNVLGTPSEEEIEALESQEAKQYIRTFAPKEAHDLAERFSASSPEALNLLKRMLVFNPKRRISVDECLAHPFFKEVRNPAIEVTASEKVRLPFNDWANMDEPQLRLGFLREMQRFHPTLQLPKTLLERAKMCS